MIPKVIHRIWLSGEEKPKNFQDCLDTWDKLEGFEIKEWTAKDFDFDKLPYAKKCFEAKRYAFASDYLRLWVLYNYGGIYLDCDVEILRNFDERLLERKEIICGDRDIIFGPVIGTEPKNPLLKKIMEYYDEHMDNKKIIEFIITPIIKDDDEKHDVLDRSFLCPKMNYNTHKRIIYPHTICIHHSFVSWKEIEEATK